MEILWKCYGNLMEGDRRGWEYVFYVCSAHSRAAFIPKKHSQDVFWCGCFASSIKGQSGVSAG